MKFARPATYLFLLACAAFLIRYYFYPPPERAIRNQLESLCRALNKETSGNISRIANVNSIANYFTSDVTINLEGRFAHTLQGRDELLQIAMAARSNIKKLAVEFGNWHIMVDPSEESARVHLTAVVRIDNESDSYVQEIKLQMKKVEGDWLVAFIEPARQLN